MKRSRGSAGHTLVELLVSMTILAIITQITLQAWRPLSGSMVQLRGRSDSQAELKLGLEFFRKDLGAAEDVSRLSKRDLLVRGEKGSPGVYGKDHRDERRGVEILYRGEKGELVRKNLTTGEEIVAISHLTGFEIKDEGSDGLAIHITVGDEPDEQKVVLQWLR